ncbi:MAG TPA: DNA polymerase III subunit delta [Opitutaceae bacterium]|nr:DNA polymerase III subunit delta [Opitutaceae bacterium]
MPPAATRNFTFICGQDDFLVGRMGRRRFEELSGEAPDEFSREIVNGFAANVDEVETAVNRFREAVLTLPMFGGRRVVWLKDVNFLADTVTGKAETTLGRVEDLQQVLQKVDPAETAVLITAAPVDRRRSFAKWCEKNADFALADGGGDADALGAVVEAEARSIGVGFGPGALELLLARIGPNTRLLVEEVHKLAAHADGAVIGEASVAELTPNAAQGDFFEMADAFFSGDLRWTLAALQRHFFAGGDARPVLAALQNRNRILIQLRALADAGEASVGPRGVEGLAKAADVYGAGYGDAAGQKSSLNVFTQNPWYLGKLAGAATLPPLRRLIDNQREFIGAFEEIIRRPGEQEDVLRDMAVRCLAA